MSSKIYFPTGGLLAFLSYGIVEVVINLFYNGGRAFFLTPVDILFFYGLLGVVSGLTLGFLYLLFKRFIKLKGRLNTKYSKLNPLFFSFTTLLCFLGFIDSVLYIIRNNPESFYILLALSTVVTVFLFSVSYITLSRINFSRGFGIKTLSVFFIFLFLYLAYPTIKNHIVSKTKRPNLLFVVMDNTRADFLGCYGYKANTTPNIDKLAKESILFEEFYSNAEWTLPSHASIFTGLYPSTHNVTGTGKGNPSLSEQFYTMAEYLKEAGYNTTAFSDNLFISRVYGFDQGFSSFTEMFDTFPPYIVFRAARKFFISSFFTKYKPPTTDLILAGFKVWFLRHWSFDKPFFAFLNLMDCHMRWNPPPPFREQFFKNDIFDIKRLSKLATVDMASKYLAGKVAISKKEFSGLKKLYAGELAYLDSRLGNLFSFLKENKAWNNTLVVVTSDHGENIGEHDLMFHCFSAHNTLTHVPFILKLPKGYPAGKRIKSKMESVDILPTLLEILGVKPRKVQGKSMLKSMFGKEVKQAVFTEVYGKMNVYRWIKERFPKEDWSKYGRNYKACYFGDFKYMLSSDGKEFLINLTTDFEENTNLAKKLPKKLEEGRKYIEYFIKSAIPFKHKFKGVALSERQKEILHSVGYTQ